MTAAIVVLGGTLGAVMVTSPLASLISAATGLENLFFEESIQSEAAVEEIIAYATKARAGPVADLAVAADPLVGVDPHHIAGHLAAPGRRQRRSVIFRRRRLRSRVHPSAGLFGIRVGSEVAQTRAHRPCPVQSP